MGAPVGNVEISAENGKVLRAFQIDPDARQKPAAQASPSTTPGLEPKTHFPGGVFGFVERTSKNVGTTVKDTSIGVGRTVKKATLGAAGTVQEVLTGERTIDREKTPGQ